MRIAFIIGLFGIVGLYGQNPLNEVHLSEKEGLAHRWVFDIVQDDLAIEVDDESQDDMMGAYHSDTINRSCPF